MSGSVDTSFEKRQGKRCLCLSAHYTVLYSKLQAGGCTTKYKDVWLEWNESFIFIQNAWWTKSKAKCYLYQVGVYDEGYVGVCAGKHRSLRAV